MMNRFQIGIRVLAMLTAALTVSAASAAENYKVDSGHSSVVFRIKHLNVAYFYGRFTDVSGKMTLDDADPSKNTFEIEVKTESVDTGDKKRDGHLKSPDFFNAREFPVMRFKSSTVKTVGADKYEVAGELTAHGVTKKVTVTLERTGAGADPWGGYRTGFETVLEIKRSDFGMDHMLNGLSDDVRLMIALEGVRE